MITDVIDTDSLQEQLRAAKLAVVLAKENEDNVRQQIRLFGAFEEDSLLYLCDKEESPLLGSVMNFLDKTDVARCAMTCLALRLQAELHWIARHKSFLNDLDSLVMSDIPSDKPFAYHDIDSGNLALEQMVAILEKKQGPVEYDILAGQLRNDFDNSMMAVARVLNFSFNRYLESYNVLPNKLLSTTIAALTHMMRLNGSNTNMSQGTLEYLFREVVSALILLSNPNTPWYEDGLTQINKAMNKLALRVAITVPADQSLTALIRMQQSLLSSPSDKILHDARFSRVLTKLSRTVIKEGGLDGLSVGELRAVLSSIDSLMELAERATNMKELIRSVEEMAKHLLLQFLKRRGAGDVRVAIEGLDCSGFVEPFLSEYEKMMERGEGITAEIDWRERLAQHNRMAQRDVIW